MLRVRTAISMAVLLAAVSIARADDADDAARGRAREHYAKGTSFFDLGRYDDAITEYELAYQAKNEPNLLYNIAQAHRLAGHATAALRFYKMFLTKVPEASNRDEVQGKIETLERLIEQQRRSQNSPPDQPLPPSGKPSVPAATAPMVTTEPATPIATRPPTARGRGKTIAGLVLAGVGVGLVGGGVACAVLEKNAADALTAANQSHAAYDPSKYSSWKTDQALAGTLLSIGAAAVVVGGVVVALGRVEARRAVDVARAGR